MNLQEIKKFCTGKKILVTGHTGFVGAWLCVALEYFGAEVIGFSLKEDKGSLYSKIKSDIKIKNYYGDIEDYHALEKCIDETNPEIVIHNAAFVFIIKCEKNPMRTFSTNVMGTVNLLEIIRNKDSVKNIIMVSSDKVYRNGDCEQIMFSEKDELDGGDPYSCSKTCQDMIVQSYYNTYFKEQGKTVNLFRPSNMIGGGDHHQIRLIPSIINSIEHNEELELRNPNAVRPWQHILDVIDAYITVLYKQWNSGEMCIYNLGPTAENICSVKEIVDILIDHLDKTNSLNTVDNVVDSNIEKQYLGLSIRKIAEEMQWKPKKSLRETLKDTYQFYLDEKNAVVIELCIKHIKNYYDFNNN